jgi:hypothetical protein
MIAGSARRLRRRDIEGQCETARGGYGDADAGEVAGADQATDA